MKRKPRPERAAVALYDDSLIARQLLERWGDAVEFFEKIRQHDKSTRLKNY